jgi:hypothetical protein
VLTVTFHLRRIVGNQYLRTEMEAPMALRQLAERNGGGVAVQLVWDDSAPTGSDLFVEYRDEGQGIFFTLFPPRDRALDAFYHPNVYSENAMRTPWHVRAALPESTG